MEVPPFSLRAHLARGQRPTHHREKILIPLGGAGDIATARRDRGRYIIEQPVVEERTTDMTGIAPYALDANNAERLWEVSVRLLPAHGWITKAA